MIYGSEVTPTVLAKQSPKALVIAKPGISFSGIQTLNGPTDYPSSSKYD